MLGESRLRSRGLGIGDTGWGYDIWIGLDGDFFDAEWKWSAGDVWF